MRCFGNIQTQFSAPPRGSRWLPELSGAVECAGRGHASEMTCVWCVRASRVPSRPPGRRASPRSTTCEGCTWEPTPRRSARPVPGVAASPCSGHPIRLRPSSSGNSAGSRTACAGGSGGGCPSATPDRGAPRPSRRQNVPHTPDLHRVHQETGILEARPSGLYRPRSCPVNGRGRGGRGLKPRVGACRPSRDCFLSLGA